MLLYKYQKSEGDFMAVDYRDESFPILKEYLTY